MGSSEFAEWHVWDKIKNSPKKAVMTAREQHEFMGRFSNSIGSGVGDDS